MPYASGAAALGGSGQGSLSAGGGSVRPGVSQRGVGSGEALGPEVLEAAAEPAAAQGEDGIGSRHAPLHAGALEACAGRRHATLPASRTFPRWSRLPASIRSRGFLFRWPGTPVGRAAWNCCSELRTAAGDSCRRNGRMRAGRSHPRQHMPVWRRWLACYACAPSLMLCYSGSKPPRRETIPLPPSIPKQLRLLCCQAPRSRRSGLGKPRRDGPQRRAGRSGTADRTRRDGEQGGTGA